MTEENPIFEKGDIKITNLRAVFAEKTYSVSNITSVETKKQEESPCLSFTMIIGGIFLAIYGFVDFPNNLTSLIIGAVLFGIAVYMGRAAKPTWIVNLTTASGEVKAYSSLDHAAIKEIVDALNTAIIQKG